MSGGFFEYKQYYIEDIIEQLEDVLVRVELEPNPLLGWDDTSLKNYVEDIPFFKEIVERDIKLLKEAYILTQRLDRYLSGDDGDNSFKERLKEDLEKIGVHYGNDGR